MRLHREQVARSTHQQERRTEDLKVPGSTSGLGMKRASQGRRDDAAGAGADQNDIRRAPRNRIAINYLLLLLIE